jgi:tetratricopeptide (TPR) repeat protein
MVRRAFFAALLASASAAHASDKPVYAPAPGWVKPAPALDPAKLGDDAPVFLILDRQQRLQDGQVWSYTDTATRAASPQVLTQIGTISLTWAPDKGDLIVHRAEIIRGSEHIDLLKGGDPLTVLHREQQLEQLQLDGMLTATMPVSGLRVGDVLRLTYSVTEKDPTLKGNVQTFAPVVADPFRVRFARERMLWPDGSTLHYKVRGDKITPTLTDTGGYHELVVTEPVAKQPDMPDDAPPRYRMGSSIEATSFADWASISRVMAPLYATEGTIAPGSPLAAEVATIEKASPDPRRRALLALQLVQDKIRYLFKGMDNGNYVPQKPADTWQLRYGDCKAKTLLLLALLHAMKIEAEPVLASSQLGDAVPARLPMPGAFDHVFVHAMIDGKPLWLDGTSSGAQLADLDDVPAFRNVLPVRAAGADIVALPARASARPDIVFDIGYDKRAGLFFPAPFTMTFTMRGPMAQMARAGAAQASKDDIEKMAAKVAEGMVGSDTTVTGGTIGFDADAGTATITATGVAYPSWTREGERYRVPLDKTVSSLSFDPDRSRAAWQAIPVATGESGHVLTTMHMRLPDGGKGFALDGAQTLDATLAGQAIHRTTSLADGVVTVRDDIVATGTEIAPADIAAERQRVSAAQTHLLRLEAPVDYPQGWATVAAVRKAHGFDAALADYQANIAAHPDEADPYLARARFYAMTYDRPDAVADLTKAIALAPTADTYVWRASLYRDLGDKDKALADFKAAQALDPGSASAISGLASTEADRGQKDAALALVQDRIDAGGKDKSDFLALKADILSKAGDKDGALATIDSAIAANPGNPTLLNNRCWIKGTLNVALDTALKDCTKSMELSDSPVSALDSRALVYFRMNRMDDALADLNAALEVAPSLAASLYMRGVIRGRGGDTAHAQADLAAARLLSPQIDEDYARWGIRP